MVGVNANRNTIADCDRVSYTAVATKDHKLQTLRKYPHNVYRDSVVYYRQ